MTDARHPERWLTDRRFLRLSDGAYRLYHTALLWTVANRGDGVLFEDDLLILPLPPAMAGYASELEGANLWAREPGMWVITDYQATQTSRSDLEVLERERERQREKMRRYRARKASESVDNPVDNPVDSGHGTGYANRQPRAGDGTGYTVTPTGTVPVTNSDNAPRIGQDRVLKDLKPDSAGTSPRGPVASTADTSALLSAMPELDPARAARYSAAIRGRRTAATSDHGDQPVPSTAHHPTTEAP